MAPDLGGWIHNFTVTDTQTHKGGYTLYKITSIVFPRSVPQALTQIVVWRRFHDVKRLHRDLKRRHKSLQLSGYLPEPIDCSFFKRFDKDVIQKRKEYILQLLDYAAQHTALYKCHAFAQFFNETTPPNKIQTLVHKAVRGLNRNLEILQDQVDFARREACDKKTSSINNDQVFPIRQQDEQRNAKKEEITDVVLELGEGEEEDDEDESLKVEYNSNVNNHPKHFLTPMASIESDDSDYIYEAALEFSQAVQAEANLEYTEAHTRYKRGVDILLYGSKDDNSDERKFIAKAKISKYLARAEDIHERFLRNFHRTLTSSPKNNFQLAIDVSGNTASDSSGLYLERPWNHMAKYKVNRLLGNKVLLVTCITEHLKPSYVMKGIEKPSSNSPTQTVFLPQHVPYMVDLLAFFQSDQKIFLLLKLALGGKLIDYVHSLNTTTHLTQHFSEMNVSAVHVSHNTLEVKDLLNNSKQLIQSVSNTLQVIKDLDSPDKVTGKSPRRSPRKIPSFHTKIPEDQLKMWSQQLLIAMHALHEKSVILSDLHMDNLLLNENGQLLLTYFYQNEGVSSDSCIHKALSPKALDEHFVAPERPLTLRSDWWSYGVILYELFLGLSFKAAHPGQIDLYGFVQYPENAEISDAAKDLLEKLLQQMPEDRLDYEKIKQHRYFEGTNWEEVKHNGYNNFTQK
ncbi:ribosomal protein S6 kinase delta-1 [Calliphora vicina]|uniref:ribosomal protein S6 kinase delta-1 n=1 Tax=Calliphora vicina TaxID=7373 RepID=UPI00325A677E